MRRSRIAVILVIFFVPVSLWLRDAIYLPNATQNRDYSCNIINLASRKVKRGRVRSPPNEGIMHIEITFFWKGGGEVRSLFKNNTYVICGSFGYVLISFNQFLFDDSDDPGAAFRRPPHFKRQCHDRRSGLGDPGEHHVFNLEAVGAENRIVHGVAAAVEGAVLRGFWWENGAREAILG
jgi:hypothetical protein